MRHVIAEAKVEVEVEAEAEASSGGVQEDYPLGSCWLLLVRGYRICAAQTLPDSVDILSGECYRAPPGV